MNGKKRGLGRGLDALLEAREPARSLPVHELSPNRLQPRSTFDEEALEELAASIRAQGVIQPLIVATRPEGGYTIIAGERRWRAAQRAGLAAVPVLVREIADDRQLLELALVENLQRDDLNPIEEAEAYRSLHESFGLSQEEIALRVGKTRSAVANTLRLLKLPEEVRELIRGGALSAGQARPLLSLATAEKQIAGARRAAQQGLSARAIEAWVSAKPAKRRSARPAEVHAAAAAEKLTQKLHAKVEIRRAGKKGTVRIHFHSEEELMRLYDWLMQRGGRP